MRRRRPERREILPDPVYQDLLVAKFINNLMKKGKKSTAQSILYEALDTVEEKTKQNPLTVFQNAVDRFRVL